MIVAALPSESARILADRLPRDLAESVVSVDVKKQEWWTSVPPDALVILDPVLLAGDGVALAMAGSTFNAAEARVVFYTSFSPESMRAVAFAAGLAPLELWIIGIDDLAQEFGRRLQRLAAHGLIADLLPRLLAYTELLPQSIRAAIVALFTTPERFFEAADLARSAMTSRRNLDRYLAEHGLGTARRLIVAAKMVHGITRFGGPSGPRSARSVAESLGYSDAEVFARQFVDVFGIRPAARASIDEARVVTAIIAYLRSTAGAHVESPAPGLSSIGQMAVR
jgi:AraC-like DNA-binding protein